jgi:ABC-type polysaccharide/polyol phosphate transport system ATPase subunit
MIKIKVENLHKKFLMETEKSQGALKDFISLFLRRDKKELQALKDVSFSVCSGQVLGVIGENGSGKSTLLKVIAGIYPQDKGLVELGGDSVYLNIFGAGLMPKLTMRENIYLMGSIMGLSREDIKEKFNSIVDFSGLKDFTDNKVCQFSTGMVARLVFSTAINCLEHRNPDIILLDEVFESGGDFDFRKKALKKMEELVKSKKAVVLVSHNLDIIKNYCNNVLWLNQGRVKKIGDPKEIVEEYVNQQNL